MFGDDSFLFFYQPLTTTMNYYELPLGEKNYIVWPIELFLLMSLLFKFWNGRRAWLFILCL